MADRMTNPDDIPPWKERRSGRDRRQAPVKPPEQDAVVVQRPEVRLEKFSG